MVHIAVDIGASSGRLVIGELQHGKIKMKEIHRFDNGFSEQNGILYWDIEHLLHEILVGLQIAKKQGHNACTLGIDTWAVDYVLLDSNGNRLQEVVSYRDRRTANTIDKVTKHLSKQAIYQKTGIQFLPINTIYQLFEEDNHLLQRTEKIMMVADYLNYRLTGNAFMEATNASTTQLLDYQTRKLDDDLLQMLGLHSATFADLLEAGHTIGTLERSSFPDFDLPDCEVIAVASHDTASAVVGTPGTNDHWAYLSSGTWSLLGIESEAAIVTEEALEKNYTNEWGVFQTFRFLKNITGMWIVQEVMKHMPTITSYEQLVDAAKQGQPFQQYIDFNDARFLNPANMIEEIQSYCRETNQIVPHSIGEIASSIYHNLAIIYALALEELEQLTNKDIHILHVVGGGSKNDFLNQLTANLSMKKIHAGPNEATALGNITMQLLSQNKINSLYEARQIIKNSFQIYEFLPEDIDRSAILHAFRQVTNTKERM